MKTDDQDTSSHPSLSNELEAIVVSGKRLEGELRSSRVRISALENEMHHLKEHSIQVQDQMKRNVAEWKSSVQAAHAQRVLEVETRLAPIEIGLKNEKILNQKINLALTRATEEARSLEEELVDKKNRYAATLAEAQRRVAEWKAQAEKSHAQSLQNANLRSEQFHAQFKNEENAHETTRTALREFQNQAQNKLNELHLLQQKTYREGKELNQRNSEIAGRLRLIQQQLESEMRLKQEWASKCSGFELQLEQAVLDVNRFKKAWPEQLEREKKIRDELLESQKSLAEYQQRAAEMTRAHEKSEGESEFLGAEITKYRKNEESLRSELHQARETSRKNLNEVRNSLSEEKSENRKLSSALAEQQQTASQLRTERDSKASRVAELEELIVSLNTGQQGLQHTIEDKQRIKNRLMSAVTQVSQPATTVAMKPPAFPLSELLKKKEDEMVCIRAEFEGIPNGHPDKKRVEEILHLITEQRDRLRELHIQA